MGKAVKDSPLVIGKRKCVEAQPQTLQERLAAMETRMNRIEELLKKAVG